jgi:hypothetical protein
MPPNKPLPPPPIWQLQPSEFISDAFPRAQQATATVSEPTLEQRLLRSLGTNTRGWFGLTPDKINLVSPEAIKRLYPDKIAGANPMEMNKTAGHEAAHSIWTGLPAEHQSAWFAIHKRDPLVAGVGYVNNPTHAFSEAYGAYVAEPMRLQRESPEAYDFFKKISGFEYARPGQHF